MKISNKAKDLILISGFLLVLFWLLIGATCWVISLFAEPIPTENINKAYNEQQIYQEMRYLQMWNYTENMSEEEWKNTFLKGE